MKVDTIVRSVFGVVGVAALAGAVYLYWDTAAFIPNAVRSEGKVVELVRSRSGDSTSYTPRVQFLDKHGERIEFLSSVGSDPPSYSVGETVEVLYLPDQPHEAKIADFSSLWLFPAVLTFFGSVFLLLSLGPLVGSRWRTRRNADLKTRGTPIVTDFQCIAVGESAKVGSPQAFHVITQWQDPATSRIRLFVSDGLAFNPEKFVKGKQIRVFVDKKDPKRYHVDLSFLPRIAQ